MQRWLFLIGLAVAGLAGGMPASASVADALELSDLLQRARIVAVGTVVESQARWDDAGRIVTDVRVRLQETIKGDHRAGDDVTLTFLGGAIGDLAMRVEGEPVLARDERALLFAAPEWRSTRLRPVGMSQGVLPVRREGDEDLVHPNGRGLSLVRRTSGGILAAAPPAILHPRPLREVVAELKRLMQAQEGR